MSFPFVYQFSGLQERLDPVDILTQLKDSGFWEGVVSDPDCFFLL